MPTTSSAGFGAMNAAQARQAMPPPQEMRSVWRGVGSCAKNLDTLDKELAVLLERLAPVMRQADKENPTPSTPTEEPSCDMALVVRKLSDRVSSAIDRVRTMRELLEV